MTSWRDFAGAGLFAILIAGWPCASPADDARAILEASEARHKTASLQYSGELTVVSKEGKTRTKAWKSYREGYAGDAKVLVRFTAPPEVRGVGFLSLGRTGRNADQWLYLPSMKRERRIATQDRDASFVGTDFSYEDMEEFDHKKYEVRLLGEETLDGLPCHVIEARPGEKGDRSVYERRVLYLRKDILYLVREDLFREEENTPAKRLLLSDVVLQDGHWLARKLEMSDLRKGSRTTVTLREAAFERPQPPDRYTIRNLNREGGD
jgi:outer membrane lipoprotein-sorting protein